MSYSIEHSKNINLDDTALPNLFIGDIMPDITDGDFIKVYIYAYMCCKQNIALTHIELAEKLGISVDKVLAAWNYFESRKIVKLIRMDIEGDLNFDVEFVDIKGMLYVKDSGASGKSKAAAKEKFDDVILKALFTNVAHICGMPTLSGEDGMKIHKWIVDKGATPEIIEAAFLHAKETKNNTKTEYVARIVKKWAEKGLKTRDDVHEYLAATDARHDLYKKLMEALGMGYLKITETEKSIINSWLDDDGYSPEQLLEMTQKTAGKTNKFDYLKGIIRKEREKSGKVESSTSPAKGSLADRNEQYRKIREKNEAEAESHRKEVYRAVPAIEKIDDEIIYLNMENMKVLISNTRDKKSATEKINKKLKEKTSERDRLVEKAGFPPDYTDIKYNCEKCKDSGVLENGASCDCLEAL